jgi:hypothetical protein
MVKAGFDVAVLRMISDLDDMETVLRLIAANRPEGSSLLCDAFLFGRELGTYGALARQNFLRTSSTEYVPPFNGPIASSSANTSLLVFGEAYRFLTKKAEGAFREYLDCHLSRPIRRPKYHNILTIIADGETYGTSGQLSRAVCMRHENADHVLCCCVLCFLSFQRTSPL